MIDGSEECKSQLALVLPNSRGFEKRSKNVFSDLQAFWRGYRVRVEVSSLKVKRARKRIKSANAAATESMKLCNRTRSALDFLLQCKNISRIVGSLVNLGE